MRNIIRMDFYRLISSRSFKVSMFLVFIISLLSKPIYKFIITFLNNITQQVAENGDSSINVAEATINYPATVDFSTILCSPFGYTLLIVLCLICAIGFAYADIANGYIKNYAGQLSNKGYTVISKFTVIGFLNLFYLVAALIGSTVGEMLVRKVVFDSDIPEGILTFFLKLLLMQSLCAILLFFTVGIKQKTAATVAGVVLGSGMLGLAYIGLNTAVHKIFNVDSFNVNDYAPDSLLESSGKLVAVNALVVSVVIIAIFLPLTVKIFSKSDVK